MKHLINIVFETVEIVRFDVRAQIQSIMARNMALLNQPKLFPPSDICFAKQYQHTNYSNNNRITLIVHSDEAPLVRSSKKCIWPCFASISECPPPVREFQSNIIILAIWTSRKKPDVNIFLEQTINDLVFLIQNGTTIFIGDHEYKIEIATQFFLFRIYQQKLYFAVQRISMDILLAHIVIVEVRYLLDNAFFLMSF